MALPKLPIFGVDYGGVYHPPDRQWWEEHRNEVERLEKANAELVIELHTVTGALVYDDMALRAVVELTRQWLLARLATAAAEKEE
jgi:hypothetical protein